MTDHKGCNQYSRQSAEAMTSREMETQTFQWITSQLPMMEIGGKLPPARRDEFETLLSEKDHGDVDCYIAVAVPFAVRAQSADDNFDDLKAFCKRNRLFYWFWDGARIITWEPDAVDEASCLSDPQGCPVVGIDQLEEIKASGGTISDVVKHLKAFEAFVYQMPGLVGELQNPDLEQEVYGLRWY